MSLFRNKYRIESARWQNWNYANAGANFITICKANRFHYFGKIVDSPYMASNLDRAMASKIDDNGPSMNLSEIGKIVEKEWLKTPEIRPDMNLQLGEFVVIPNHFHAILTIGENEYNTPSVQTRCIASPSDKTEPAIELPINGWDNIDTSDILTNETPSMASLPPPQRKNLASIVRGFKSAVTVQARIITPAFGWQARYHDHVIRNYEEYRRIENYIVNNPKNWLTDKFR